jgi:formylglycine-generating enzyme required for sulfatase activity
MGTPKGDPDGYDDEKPPHPVALRDFYLGQYPVTQALWLAVMGGKNPSRFVEEDRPVEQVSWDDAQAFLKKLNGLTATTRPAGYAYCLPTEAQWEYAARGGPWHADGYRYAGSDRLKEVGWFGENSSRETKPVGQKYPNQLGFYDLSGNVWEWCEDDWHDNYDGAPDDGTAWINRPQRGARRVVRGGSWNDTARYCRVACRYNFGPGYRNRTLGFRLALSLQSVG